MALKITITNFSKLELVGKRTDLDLNDHNYYYAPKLLNETANSLPSRTIEPKDGFTTMEMSQNALQFIAEDQFSMGLSYSYQDEYSGGDFFGIACLQNAQGTPFHIGASPQWKYSGFSTNGEWTDWTFSAEPVTLQNKGGIKIVATPNIKHSDISIDVLITSI